VLDRDYRSDAEINEVRKELTKHGFVVHIHGRKELENYLLDVTALARAVDARMIERSRRSGEPKKNVPDIWGSLNKRWMKLDITFSLNFNPDSPSSCTERLRISIKRQSRLKVSKWFEETWASQEGRLTLIPGKEVLAHVNKELQATVDVSVSDAQVAAQFRSSEIHPDIRSLVLELEGFAKTVQRNDKGAA